MKQLKIKDMKKIPFDISYKDDIIKGKVKVVTRGDKPVNIEIFNGANSYPIRGTFERGHNIGTASWTIKGYWKNDSDLSDLDLFLLIDDDLPKPKFKVGDWIVRNYPYSGTFIYKVVGVKQIGDETYGYELDDGTYFSGSLGSSYHLWTIQDAKDGDVLAREDKNFISPFIAIYKSLGDTVYEDIAFNSRCFIGFDGNFYTGEEGHTTEGIHPATKEQCDLLFQKMKEAGYEWYAEKKKLKRIEQNLTEFEYSLKHIMEEAIECGDTHNLKADAELLLAMARKEIEKDLPKWTKNKYDEAPYPHIGGFKSKYLIKGGYDILISDLDKLPKIE